MKHEIDLQLNPEPWAVGTAFSGRRGNKLYSGVSPNAQLQVYQNAVKEEIGVREFCEGRINYEFFFWRQTQEYKTERQRTARAHQADGTNMAKALEDALQGCLYNNDRDMISGTWKIMSQGPDTESRIYIRVWDELNG